MRDDGLTPTERFLEWKKKRDARINSAAEANKPVEFKPAVPKNKKRKVK